MTVKLIETTNNECLIESSNYNLVKAFYDVLKQECQTRSYKIEIIS